MKPSLIMEEIFPEIKLIQEKQFQNHIINIWEALWQESDWEDIFDLPVSPKTEYSHVIHNRAVVQNALHIANTFKEFHNSKVNRDILLTAGLLQDVSKLVEFSPTDNGKVEYTAIGLTYPHAFWGAQMAIKHGIPHQICEIILDHTPDSARFPKSIEGKILYYADQLDMIAIVGDRFKKESYIRIFK